MKTEPLESVLREALACHEALRKLSYSPNDIFFQMCKVDNQTIFIRILLKAQGREFAYGVGVVKSDQVSITKRWQELVASYNGDGSMTEAERKRIWTESRIYRNKVDFVAAMTFKGFSSRKNLQ